MTMVVEREETKDEEEGEDEDEDEALTKHEEDHNKEEVCPEMHAVTKIRWQM